MPFFWEVSWQILLMVILLAISGLFSGAETAFSNISRRQASILADSGGKFQKLTVKLLSSPSQLLSSLLFGNMAANVLFFAMASIISLKFGKQFGPTTAAASAFLAFMLLVMFGEMLPKSIAYAHSRSFCAAASPFCYVSMRLFSHLLKFFDLIIVRPAVRLLTGSSAALKATETVTANQLISLLDLSRQSGVISNDENQLLAEVVELGLLKVRHVIRPRVDMVSCEVSSDPESARKLMSENQLTKIAVYRKSIDNITGLLNLRDLLLTPQTLLEKLVKPVEFVPEQKSVESLLEFFRESKTDTAIVVDEYGGITGQVSLEDIVEELIGPLEETTHGETVQQIGPLKYRLDGDLSIHDWGSIFGIDPSQSRLSTVGGLTMALLGKIPSPGDVATLKNLTFTVEKVRKRRIETLILSLEPIDTTREETNT